MAIEVRKISKTEVPKRAKTYRPELTQSNGHIAEMLASLMGMSVADVVNQVFEQASLIELISEKKGIAIRVPGKIGDLDKFEFDQISHTLEEYENSVQTDEGEDADESVGSETSEEESAGGDLGKSKPVVTHASKPRISGIGQALSASDDEEEMDDEDLEEAANKI